MPRIITVDPTGTISRIVRSAMDLLDLSATQVDVPSVAEALEELSRKANIVITAFDLDDNMKGFEFALRVKKVSEETSVLILGDVDDPDEFDEETALDSPFVYLSRPVNIHQFLRVLVAGLESPEAMRSALPEPTGITAAINHTGNMGPVPTLDIEAAKKTIDPMMADLGALAIILANRLGEVVVERGQLSQIDRGDLTRALTPIMTTNIGVKDLVGGQVSTVQLYDGDDYDIFVLSVGLHHFLCIIFEGQMGSKQFGMVNRFGRRAVEDLIALLGANAFFIQPSIREEPTKRSQTVKKIADEEEPIQLAHAEIDAPTEHPGSQQQTIAQLEPIQDLNLDDLFGSNMDVDESLFDLDKIEEIAKENQQNDKSKLDWDDAINVGLLKK